ncbi:hypothetical protein, partial [Enterococcus faecium]
SPYNGSIVAGPVAPGVFQNAGHYLGFAHGGKVSGGTTINTSPGEIIVPEKIANRPDALADYLKDPPKMKTTGPKMKPKAKNMAFK